MAAATAQPEPGVFTFLKDGILLPARRCGLFVLAFALNIVLSTALYLFGLLVVVPLNAAVNPEDYGAVIASADDAEFNVSKALLLLAAGVAYLVLYLAAELATKVATAYAAVAACSGERHTSASFLRRVRGSLLRGSATVLLGRALLAACTAAAVLALPLMVYLGCSTRLLLLGAVLAVLAFQFRFYLRAVCAMAVVASAVEARHRPGGAVARAWRLLRGTGGERALLYIAVMWALEMAGWSVRALAAGRLPSRTGGVVGFLVSASVNYVLRFVVDVISMSTTATYYFECRKNEEKAGHID